LSPEVRGLLEQVLAHLVPVDEPLVLISQIQRSGGSLLTQLLDGHPALHNHPAELHIGTPKDVWPEIPLGTSAKKQFAILRERLNERFFAEGYRKRMPEHEQYDEETFPFLQPPALLETLFRRVAPERPERAREVLDAYFTAYFNSWLDNGHLRDGPKRWVTAFTPRLAWGASRRDFAADYPDGRLIAIVREPHDWYASARAHHPRYADCESSASEWMRGAHEIADAARERPESTLVILFEDLVDRTEEVMRLVSEWLGIAYAEILVRPTFNDMPILANSSFQIERHGILADAVGRGRLLSDRESELIDRVAADAHALATSFAARPS